MATTPETNVISNAGATMPVMSSPFPREMTIKVNIPAAITALIAIAEHFKRLNAVADDSGYALFIRMWSVRDYRNNSGKVITTVAAHTP